MRATATTAAVLVLLCCQSGLASSLAITPTTTLSAETSNNTSAASTFTAQSNGNIAPANVSKVDSHTLLYPGSTTKIYTHFMGWFGPSNHMNVGYSSADPAQIQKQVDDQVSRGIDGVIIDWYGPGHYPDDNATQLMMTYAQSLPGAPFRFAVMEDVGALSVCANTYGCDLNKTLISHLTYLYNTYEGSPAYLQLNGQPVVFLFGMEKYAINWDFVKASVPGNPAFMFQNAGGFTHADSAGAFAWVQINRYNPNDWQQWYLDNFYLTALNYPFQHTFGVAYVGFNDTLATWSQNRIMNQNCGQTWLKTWNELSRFYNNSRQLESVEITTWNDYEEGTEIETGIENCVTVAASVAGNTLNWVLNGNENTIDHYTIFVSLDGENLMPISDASTGIRTLDLAGFGLAPGSYKFYVKAVARPSMTNKMSNVVTYNVPDPGPTVTLSVTPASGIAPLMTTASTAGSTSPGGDITSSIIDFGDGTKLSGTTLSHLYAAPGTYTLTATLTDAMNVSATTTALVTVIPDKPPVAVLSLSPASGKAPFTVSASTASSSDPDGTITGSQINFGDGTIVNATSASYTYSVPGTYTVTGTVTDNGGLTASASATANVLMVPGKVTVTSPSAGATVSSPVQFIASATANTGYVITAMRIYVDNIEAYTVGTNRINTALAIPPGAHYIVVLAWDNTGAAYQSSLNITVPNKSPVASLSVSPLSTTTGKAVSASMSGSYDPDGTVASYSINFGDGAVVNGISASHSYANPGTYTITAVATDNLGASTSATAAVTISPASGVYVTLPANGSTVSNPVHFVASATSQTPITAMRIYVDNNEVYTVGAAKIDKYLTLSLGQHYIVVQAWDSAGAVFKTPLNVTVK